MGQSWSGRGWSASIDDDGLTVLAAGTTTTIAAEEAQSLAVRRRLLGYQLRHDGRRVGRLGGLRRTQARHMSSWCARLGLSRELAACVRWATDVDRAVADGRSQQRWITREQVDELLARQPRADLASRLSDTGASATLTEGERAALAWIDVDVPQLVAHANEGILAAELVSCRDLFDRIERTPLTAEQARAVACLDNRVHVIAAAGSGKTSVIVARAAYAVQRGFVAADRILLLAFNRAAAAELQERIDTRLAAAGINAEGIKASTFHSFGLSLIGKSTGAKPRLAPWLDAGGDVRVIGEIVDDLRDHDRKFRAKWDLYRLLFASAPTTNEPGDPDTYDKATKSTGFRTFAGELVKSRGELMIANWLYLNGVSYEYERPYSVDVADAEHSQYRPDFYYPDIDTWHEHWALDRVGSPPQSPEFAGYAQSMDWRRQTHATYGTKLIETTWAGVVYGDGLAALGAELARRGVELDWNPDRVPAARQPVKHETLFSLVRSFMTHVKSNSLTREALDERLTGSRRGLSGFRTGLFLDLYWPIQDAWDSRLRTENLVDFEDMLVMAADVLETGAVEPEYDLVMVDEFQDASHARARLVSGLLRRPGKHLLAVGDDWQSINRFAGADISIMTGFEAWFGAGPTLRLETTFRCPQSICDTASSFVSKNPSQFRKNVTAFRQDDYGPPVTLVRAANAQSAVRDHLFGIADRLGRGEIEPGRNGKVSVNVLGRYRFDCDVLPAKFPPGLDVVFRTAHGSKGLEADYVVIPKLTAGTYGFPSGIADDQVLDLVMADPDGFPHAEERRLLYVALTRARREVTVITEVGRESPFAIELIKDQLVTVAGDDPHPQVCTKCDKGIMVIRTGPKAKFLGCSRFPACLNTAKLN